MQRFEAPTDDMSSLIGILPSYMVPSSYLIFERKPGQTMSGKVDRRQLITKAR